MAGSQQLLVIAIDAASPALLRQWVADGSLPNLARLMADGVVGGTRSVETFYTGSTWPSFYTASSPAHHGIYWLSQVTPGTYRSERMPADAFGRRPALWDVLSDAGKNVLVVDVPLSRLSPRLNGAQVVEWNTHDVLFGFQTSPPEFAQRIRRLAGAHPVPPPCDAKHRDADAYAGLADKLVAGAASRGRLTRALLNDEPWDFAIQVFSEAHCAGHQLWHQHDPAHPAFDQHASNGDPVHRVYQAVDAAIGEALRDIGPTTNVVVMTLHDMSFMTGSSVLLEQVLERLGVTARPVTTPAPRSVWHRAVDVLRALYRIVPKPIRHALFVRRTAARARRSDGAFTLGIDPTHSQCFAVDMGPLVGGIRLNQRGREAQGVLNAEDRDTFCDTLTGHLLELKHSGSDLPLVRRVLRTSDLFSGPLSDTLPDLVVEWNLEMPLGSLAVGEGTSATLSAESARIGRVTHVNDYCRTGEHREGGLFVAVGPQVHPGAMERTVDIYDLAPTFAAMVGCTMPSPNGQLIPELLGGVSS